MSVDDLDLLEIRGTLGFYGADVARPEVDLRAAIARSGAPPEHGPHMHLAQVRTALDNGTKRSPPPGSRCHSPRSDCDLHGAHAGSSVR